jgi:hypothetical protein
VVSWPDDQGGWTLILLQRKEQRLCSFDHAPDAVAKAKKVVAGTEYSHCAVHGEPV